jgi:hypothetical protein
MNATSFFFVNTPFKPICMDLVQPFKWPQKEFKVFSMTCWPFIKSRFSFQEHPLVPSMFHLSIFS